MIITDPSFASDPPPSKKCRAYRNTNYTITNDDPVKYDTISFDPDNIYNPANYRFIMPNTGYYLIANHFTYGNSGYKFSGARAYGFPVAMEWASYWKGGDSNPRTSNFCGLTIGYFNATDYLTGNPAVEAPGGTVIGLSIWTSLAIHQLS